ncbi:Glutamate receptor ionotropic, NMDA 3A, partial [Frankliniella fusca]
AGVGAAAPRTVVVGDMVVADDSDTEGDLIEEEVDDDSDEDKPKVLRVITRRPARAGGARTGTAVRAEPEPAWHALLRRTPSTRTASIARTQPRAQQSRPAGAPAPAGACQQAPLQGSSRTRPMPPRPAQLYGTPSRIIRTDGSPKPAVNVPAKVLVPRNRLLFPLVTRNGRMLPVTSTRMPLGVAYRRQDGSDAPQVFVLAGDRSRGSGGGAARSGVSRGAPVPGGERRAGRGAGPAGGAPRAQRRHQGLHGEVRRDGDGHLPRRLPLEVYLLLR